MSIADRPLMTPTGRHMSNIRCPECGAYTVSEVSAEYVPGGTEWVYVCRTCDAQITLGLNDDEGMS